MASPKWPSGPSIEDNLLTEFYGFSFFKAVNLLEALYPDRKPLGQTLEPDSEVVRFSVKPGFTFPASDISNLDKGGDSRPVNMEVTFMGLIGPSGVLPHWYNELAFERIREKDFSLTAFLDIFHHRLISLFYLAWKKNRFPENYVSGAGDRRSLYALSLLGLGTPGLADMIGLPKESLIFYSGLLSRTVPSALTIESAVEYFSGTTAKVHQFIERALQLNPEDQTRLGALNSRLGEDTVCGNWIWENQTKFRIDLGPVGYDSLLRFLPTGDMLQPIFAFIRFMVGIEYEFDIRLFLNRTEVPPCILGLGTDSAPRLGWSTWVKSSEFTHEEDPYITFEETG